MKYKYAIIGCGAAGKVHAYHFSHDPRIECVAVADINVKNAQFFRSHFGFRTAYHNYKDMLANEDLDIVSIASPPGDHLEQLTSTLQRKAHILCEKPLVISEKEIKIAQQLIKSSSNCVRIMLPRRFYNNTLAVKKVLKQGQLGKIKQVSFNLRCHKSFEFYSTWRGKKALAGGGVLMGQAIHSIDQLIYLFGPPSRVEGVVTTKRDNIDVEDEAEAIIYFQNDIKAHLSATTNSDVIWQGITKIQGENGQVILDSAEVILWNVAGSEYPIQEEKETVPEQYKSQYYGPGHLKVIRDFLDVVDKGKSANIKAADSLIAVKLILEIYRSSQTQTAIDLPMPNGVKYRERLD